MFQNNVSVRLITYYLVHIIKNKLELISYVYLILFLYLYTCIYIYIFKCSTVHKY